MWDRCTRRLRALALKVAVLRAVRPVVPRAERQVVPRAERQVAQLAVQLVEAPQVVLLAVQPVPERLVLQVRLVRQEPRVLREQ